jgi:hypothetical protein
MKTNTTGNGFWGNVLKGAVAYFWVLIVAGLAGVAFNVFLTFAGF